MNEAETRAGCIDPALAAAGRSKVKDSRAKHEYPVTPWRLDGAGKYGKVLSDFQRYLCAGQA
jgi:hypothetical protein